LRLNPTNVAAVITAGAAATVAVILVVLAVATGAFAQDDDPIKVPQQKTDQAAPVAPAAPPQKYYLELDQADLNAVSAALVELPKKLADPLILKFNAQLQSQQDKIAPAAREALSPPAAKKIKK
jgi:hypothetical protein